MAIEDFLAVHGPETTGTALPVEIHTNTRVTRVLEGAVEAGGEPIPVGLTVWAAGVVGHPALAQVEAERDRLGRLLTRPTMQLKAHPEVYGAGDAVAVEGKPDASIPIIPAALAHAQLAYTYATTAVFFEPTEPVWAERAKEEINRAQALDPISSIIARDVAGNSGASSLIHQRQKRCSPTRFAASRTR